MVLRVLPLRMAITKGVRKEQLGWFVCLLCVWERGNKERLLHFKYLICIFLKILSFQPLLLPSLLSWSQTYNLHLGQKFRKERMCERDSGVANPRYLYIGKHIAAKIWWLLSCAFFNFSCSKVMFWSCLCVMFCYMQEVFEFLKCKQVYPWDH